MSEGGWCAHEKAKKRVEKWQRNTLMQDGRQWKIIDRKYDDDDGHHEI